MNLFTPEEMVRNYSLAGAKKTQAPAWKLLILGILAGALIGYAALVTNMACYKLENPSMIRVLSGVLFGFGLGMVILSGAELFTGNNLLAYAVCTKAISPMQMLKNWIFVYLGNLAGSLFVAFLAVYGGTGGLLSGAVGETMVSTAVSKCGLSVPQMLMRGILCNILVCIAVWNAIRADNTAGKVLAAFLPTFAFVLCGFEHCC